MTKYASIHIYANKCEAIYMSAIAAFFNLKTLAGRLIYLFTYLFISPCLYSTCFMTVSLPMSHNQNFIITRVSESNVISN